MSSLSRCRPWVQVQQLGRIAAPATDGDNPAVHERRVSTATATWFAITSHYADQLASAYGSEEFAGSAA